MDSSKSQQSLPKSNIFTYWWDTILNGFNSTSGNILILIFSLIITGSILWVISNYSAKARFIFFNQGVNEYQEGIIGKVKILNPALTINSTLEQDIDRLLFNKLVRISSNGQPKPELALTWNQSEDGKIYEFYLRQDVKWHDGTPLTAKDVVFTYNLLKGRKEAGALGNELKKVKSIEAIDLYTVKLELPEEISSFIELMNVFILPEHLLKDVSYSKMAMDSFSTKPVGTGPFIFDSISDTNIKLKRNDKYFEKTESLNPTKTVVINFYQDENKAISDLKAGKISAISNITYDSAKDLENYNYLNKKTSIMYTRTRLIYINMQSKSSLGVLQSKKIRQAISSAINRNTIQSIKPGVEVAVGPIPKNSWAFDERYTGFTYDLKIADQLLKEEGWIFPDSKEKPAYRYKNDPQKKDKEPIKIKLNLTYWKNNPINEKIALEVQKDLENVGIRIELDPQDFTEMNDKHENLEQKISTRNYDLMLFEIETNLDPDRYEFWNSTQIDYPGLNLSGYMSQRSDEVLAFGRKNTNLDKRKEYYSRFQKQLLYDVPAVFLYHPQYIYIYNKNLVKPTFLDELTQPSDRFLNIRNWEVY